MTSQKNHQKKHTNTFSRNCEILQWRMGCNNIHFKEDWLLLQQISLMQTVISKEWFILLFVCLPTRKKITPHTDKRLADFNDHL